MHRPMPEEVGPQYEEAVTKPLDGIAVKTKSPSSGPGLVDDTHTHWPKMKKRPATAAKFVFVAELRITGANTWKEFARIAAADRIIQHPLVHLEQMVRSSVDTDQEDNEGRLRSQ